MSDGPSEGERSTAYDTWGPICVICGAPPRDPTYGELVNGKTKSRIALHHADGDRTWMERALDFIQPFPNGILSVAHCGQIGSRIVGVQSSMAGTKRQRDISVEYSLRRSTAC